MQGECCQLECIVPTESFGVMVFSWFWLGPLFLVKNKLTAYKHSLDNLCFQLLWQQFGEDYFLFQHNCAQRERHKDMVWSVCIGRTGVAHTEHWPQPHETFLGWSGMRIASLTFSSRISAWPNKCSFDLIAPKILRKAFPEKWSEDSCKRGPNSILSLIGWMSKELI